jgi:cytochrome P450
VHTEFRKLVSRGFTPRQVDALEPKVRDFVISLGPDDAEHVAHSARWLVWVMTSLFLFPRHDEADERAILEEFVVPVALPNQPNPTR